MSENCFCYQCLDSSDPCSLNCNLDEECIGCENSRIVEAEQSFEGACAQGRF